MEGGDVLGDEAIAQNQVLGRIPADRQLRSEEHVGLNLLGPGHRLDKAGGVAREVADCEVDLGAGHPEEVHRGEVRDRKPAPRPNG